MLTVADIVAFMYRADKVKRLLAGLPLTAKQRAEETKFRLKLRTQPRKVLPIP